MISSAVAYLAFSGLFVATNQLMKAPLDFMKGKSLGTSPWMQPTIKWDEAIVSWNTEPDPDLQLNIECQAGDETRTWFTVGKWNLGAPGANRTSVNGQSDSFGEMDTDTLVIHGPASQRPLRIRITASRADEIKLVTVCFSNTEQSRQNANLAPEASCASWGELLSVPSRKQMDYPNGGVLCSATSTSMLLSFWAQRLGKPELDADVPEVVSAIYDQAWKGTGNWPFNMALAGSRPGLVAYIARFTSIRELEQWIEAGIPVATSVSYDLLKGKGQRGKDDGHLVVLVGFTKAGDPIFNDPGTSASAQTIYRRADFEKGWADSGRTVYLVYEAGVATPSPNLGEWLP